MLHVTNGDSAATVIRTAGVGGEVLPWRDVLHEGPVPDGVDDERLADLRAAYVSDRGWGVLAEVRRALAVRDRTLAAAAGREAVVLWFEHDLYDQLQLIQILDRLRSTAARDATSLICIDRFEGIEPFHGLGQLDPRQVGSLLAVRAEVTADQFDVAARAWRAFRSADPTPLTALLGRGSAALPFLGNALRRHLEQYPSVANGLGRTEQQILDAIPARGIEAGALFRLDKQQEQAPFLGDTTLFSYLDRLGRGERPLVEWDAETPWPGRTVRLTDCGRSVRVGKLDAVKINGIDRWWGGVRQVGHEVPWRWDRGRGRLVSRER